MNPPETTLTVTITGEVAEWLEQQAASNMRTPSQHVMHVLALRKQTSERNKQATAERKARREALFGKASRRAGQQAARTYKSFVDITI